MDVDGKIKDEILFRAEKLLYENERLIKQCDSWLPAEEGNRNMLKRIEDRKKTSVFKKSQNSNVRNN